jgi:hypothetical protein
MIIVSYVRRETEVGIMIAPQLLFTEDTVTGNRLNPIKEESIEVGSTTEKLNGSKIGLLV